MYTAHAMVSLRLGGHSRVMEHVHVEHEFGCSVSMGSLLTSNHRAVRCSKP